MVMTKLRLAGMAFLALCALGVGVGQIVPPALGDKPSPGPKASLVRGQIDTIELPKEAFLALGIKVGQIKARGEAPPPGLILVGTLNYDPDRLFTIRSRYPGELAEMGQVVDNGKPSNLRFGDKVGSGDLLAVVWSQQLGTAKVALVDAIIAHRRSQDTLKRYEELFQNGALALASLKAAERQLQLDGNTLLTAERSLKLWRVPNKEIEDLKTEANSIHDQKKVRNAKDEAKWARVEIRVPSFDKDNPNRKLVIVEKNANINDMVDPINTAPLFKLADKSRLEISAHAPEDYMPLIRERLAKGGLQWEIRFQTDPPNTPPRKLDIRMIAPSMGEPPPPMVIGYLPNPEGKYLIGQFVTATIPIPETRQELAIPSSALVEEGGKTYVLVQPDPAKLQVALWRVAVVRRDRDVVHLLTLLTTAQRKQGIRTLRAGDGVITAGAVELKALLEDLKVRGND